MGPPGTASAGSLAALTLSLLLLAGCALNTTTVERVWRDSARSETALGSTLVVALFDNVEVATALEQEWVRQLRDRGIESEALGTLLPGQRPPDKERVVELVKARGFRTLLVSELMDVKHVERDVSTSQVAVVRTRLYDTSTEQPFWSARSDTLLREATGEGPVRSRARQIAWFVDRIVRELSKSKVL